LPVTAYGGNRTVTV